MEDLSKDTSVLKVERVYPGSYDADGNSLFYNDESIARSMNSRRLFRTRKLRFGSLEDLALVDVSSALYPDTNHPDYALKEYIRTSFGDREIPVYIFDDHSHALFAWFEAFHEGKIQKGATIYHVDDHSDGGKRDIILPSESLDEISMLAKRIDYDEFIDPAIKMGLIKDVFWIESIASRHETKRYEIKGSERGIACSVMGSGELLTLLGKESIEAKKTIVDIDVDYFTYIEPGSKEEAREIEKIKKVIRKAGVITFAISPGFIDSMRAIDIIKRLLSDG